MKHSLLIVEDDSSIQKTLRDAFAIEGYPVRVVDNAEDALVELRRESAQLLLLDVRLPGMSGFDLCRRLRETPDFKRLPILFLTSKGEEAHRVLGLEIGGNDYITKPFSLPELLARVKAALRTAYPEEGEDAVLRGGPVVVDTAKGAVTMNGQPVKLPRKEYDLLILFLRKKGRILSRAVIMEAVWGQDYMESSRTVDTHIYRLRKNLGNAGLHLRAVDTMGYKWEDSP